MSNQNPFQKPPVVTFRPHPSPRQIPPLINRGLSGGPKVITDKKWYSIARVEPLNPDQPWDPSNDHMRTVKLFTDRGTYFTTGGLPLGVVAYMTYGAQGSQFTAIFDVPENGQIHAPVCSSSVTVDVCLTARLFTPATLASLPAGFFDNPQKLPLAPDPAHSSGPCTVYAGISQDQGFATSVVNQPKRHIMVVYAPGDSATVPIPKSTVAFTVFGPSDLIVNVDVSATDAPTSLPLNANSGNLGQSLQPQPFPPGAVSITASSASGGLADFVFYLDF